MQSRVNAVSFSFKPALEVRLLHWASSSVCLCMCSKLSASLPLPPLRRSGLLSGFRGPADRPYGARSGAEDSTPGGIKPATFFPSGLLQCNFRSCFSSPQQISHEGGASARAVEAARLHLHKHTYLIMIPIGNTHNVQICSICRRSAMTGKGVLLSDKSISKSNYYRNYTNILLIINHH